MGDPFDNWKQTDPSDRDLCEEHGHPIPCAICRMEHAESLEDAKREEAQL
jgi:hypothetical protein